MSMHVGDTDLNCKCELVSEWSQQTCASYVNIEKVKMSMISLFEVCYILCEDCSCRDLSYGKHQTFLPKMMFSCIDMQLGHSVL